MRGRVVLSLICAPVLAVLAGTATAQSLATTEQPLSVIDWLGNQQPDGTLVAWPPNISTEPPVAETALVPDVQVQTLSEGGARQIGLVPSGVTGLPADLWVGSDLKTLKSLLQDLPDLKLPAAQALLYTVLLTDALAPEGRPSAGDAFALARVEALVKRGALDPALSLIEQAGVTLSPESFDLWMDISLLTGTEDRACATLNVSPHLSAAYDTRIFCSARAQRWEDAALTFGSADALGLLPDAKLDLLARFLDPEAYEGDAALPVPRAVDPLTFRLFETIGEPIPTGNLPRAFAVADLRDLAGWKAQLEAAERLTRAGALPDNRLLGLYADRKPAASGGVWDRVAHVQRFDTALRSGSTDAVRKTLPAAWQAMADVDLEVTFAQLFAEPLSKIALDGPAGEIALKTQLLSQNYETAAAAINDGSLPVSIALGELPQAEPANGLGAAIYQAFGTAPPRSELVQMAQDKRLGEAILRTLVLLHGGSQGDEKALTEALATLRVLGLEDTARRAALQLLVLER